LIRPNFVGPDVRVLVVDDEDTIRNAVARFLLKRGYDVRMASSGREALRQVAEGGIALMLLDVRMPGMSGLDVVPEALHLAPEIAIVMLSATTDPASAALCLQRGAMEYLTKPVELSDLATAIERSLRRRDTLLRERSDREHLSVMTLEALISALESKDRFLSGHSARVTDFAAGIAKQLDLSSDQIEQVRRAGRLHDLGHIGVREAVLHKQGPLTAEEYQHVKQHVVIGSAILAPLALGPIADSVRGHHERCDGTGYPDRLKGERIPLTARILCAAEVYDALTTARPYQPTMSPDEAVLRMRALAGSVIDPWVMEAIANR
jgi:response regulator RpfG family c-di-GMP phosphodiesterase